MEGRRRISDSGWRGVTGALWLAAIRPVEPYKEPARRKPLTISVVARPLSARSNSSEHSTQRKTQHTYTKRDQDFQPWLRLACFCLVAQPLNFSPSGTPHLRLRPPPHPRKIQILGPGHGSICLLQSPWTDTLRPPCPGVRHEFPWSGAPVFPCGCRAPVPQPLNFRGPAKERTNGGKKNNINLDRPATFFSMRVSPQSLASVVSVLAVIY